MIKQMLSKLDAFWEACDKRADLLETEDRKREMAFAALTAAIPRALHQNDANHVILDFHKLMDSLDEPSQ